MNLSPDNPNLDLDVGDMSHAQLCGQVMRLIKRVQQLEQFESDAFAVYPNIDLDIEFAKRQA